MGVGDKPYRMWFLFDDTNGYLLGQRCCAWEHETVPEFPVPKGATSRGCIVLYSSRRMLYDPHDDLIGQRAPDNYQPQPVPLYASTHAHRHLRGSQYVDNVGWIRLAQASATYAPPHAMYSPDVLR